MFYQSISTMYTMCTALLYYMCHYIKIIVRKCKALQSLNKIELRVQKIKERKPRTNEILI